MSLQTSPTQLDTLRRKAAAAFPEECCGLLLGSRTGTAKTTKEVCPLVNDQPADARHHRYAINPSDLLEHSKQARVKDMEVIGFYHSHPDAPARPSAHDTERAWPGYSYVIVSVRDGVPGAIASWVLNDDGPRFIREPLLHEA